LRIFEPANNADVVKKTEVRQAGTGLPHFFIFFPQKFELGAGAARISFIKTGRNRKEAKGRSDGSSGFIRP
jgi:hypothetical protein